jgi:hypothetical protein
LTPVVLCQRQADAVYFDLSNAFDLVPHNMLLHKLSSFGFSAYVSWFRCYLTSRQSRVRISGTLPLSFQVKYGVPQGSVLGPILFNVFINDLCNWVSYCKLLIFADYLKIFRVINPPYDCLLIQSDMNSVSNWCTANSISLNIAKTRVVPYTRKTNFLSYEYSCVILPLHAPAAFHASKMFLKSSLSKIQNIFKIFFWSRKDNNRVRKIPKLVRILRQKKK